MTAKIVALYSPYPKAGKSTVANYLIRDYGFKRIAFADPIRDMIGRLLEISGNDSSWVSQNYVEKKETPISNLGGVSVRDMMINFGQSARQLREDFWVNLLEARLGSADGCKFVIDDMRFENEMVRLKELGAVTVRITNPGRDIPVTKVVTETNLEGQVFDFQISNDLYGGLGGMYGQVDSIIEFWNNRR